MKQLLNPQEFRTSGRDFLLLSLACMGLFFFMLGSIGFIDPGDGYFTEAAREMVESGNYVVPHLNYQIYFSKPILIYWLISSAYHVFGINEFAGRFWSALSATILVFACYALTKTLQGRRAALIAALALASSPLIITFARMAMIDIILSSFIGVALWAFINAVFLEKPFWWLLGYTTLALGVLIKGPIAPALFVLAAAIFVVIKRPGMNQLKQWFLRLHLIQGLFLFVAILAPWCVAVSLATKGLFLKVFLLFENLGRFSGQVNHKHPELWFYLPVLAYGFFPWIICLPAAIKDALQGKLINAQQGKLINVQQPQCNHDAALFLACFGLVVVIFFSLATAKLQTYVLPAWFVFAALIGMWIDKSIAAGSAAGAIKLPNSLKYLSTACLIFALALVVVTLVVVVDGDAFMPGYKRLIPELTPGEKFAATAVCVIFLLGWVYQWFLYRKREMEKWLRTLILPMVLAGIIAAPAAFEIGYRLKQADLNAVAMKGKGLKLSIFQEFKPSLMFYTRQPIDTFFHPGQLVADGGPLTISSTIPWQPQYVISSDAGLQTLRVTHGDKFKTVYKQGDWGLYLSQGLTLARLPTLEQTFSKNLNLNVGDYTWGTLPFAAGKN